SQSGDRMVVLMRRLILVLALSGSHGQDQSEKKPDRVISIVAERFTFNPSKIKLKQGDLAEFVLTIENTGQGFRIQGANIDLTIPQQGKGEARVRLVLNQKGRFVFECSRPCGAGHNLMRGVIEVK